MAYRKNVAEREIGSAETEATRILNEAIRTMTAKLAEHDSSDTPQEDSPAEPGEAGSFIVRAALDYMRQHCTEHISLADVADNVYVSQWHLSKLINRHTNQSFLELLNSMRIEQAKALLAARKSVVLLKNEGGLLPLDKKNVKKIAVFGNRAEEILKDWYGALPAYSVSPLAGIQAAVEGTDVEVRFQKWDSDGNAQELAEWADVAIVCVGNHPNTSPDWKWEKIQAPWGEGTVAGDGREAVDRRSLELESEDLIKMVWKANPNTVVALISSFPYAIDWTQENVPAILHMTQCGQETGNALADVIFGDYNPAGRTTQTWVRDILELPNMMDYDIRNGRTYMYYKGEPLYPFGYGLSYTSFDYSGLKVRREEEGVRISFNLKNTGGRDGEEVVQVYARFAGDDAARRLRGFDRVAVRAGEKTKVEIFIPEEDLKLWDLEDHSFALPQGECVFEVGASSADIRLESSLKL